MKQRADFILCVLAIVLTGSGCTVMPQRTTAYDRPVVEGRLERPDLTEISGVAASGRQSGLLWMHNDSGDEARLYAVDTTGTMRGTVRLDGVEARDWEDIASFRWQGESWLLVADVGDNFAVRHDLKLHLFPEPDPEQFRTTSSLTVTPTTTIALRYPNGPRDCEGVTVCPDSGEILLISKRTEPPVLYRVPLQIGPRHVSLTAEKSSPLPGILPPTPAERAIPGRLGQYRSQVTAFDLSSDGRRAAALTYGNIWIYPRKPGESWEATLTRPPQRIPVEGLPQAEALCFDGDSYDLIVTTERDNAPVQRYRAR